MKLNVSLILFIFLMGLNAKAISSICRKELNTKRMQMNVIASNIANVNSSRTPAGGPYKRQELRCTDENCELITYDSYLTEHLPGHPDADENGYVKLPNINLNEEKSALAAVTREYESIVEHCK
jgi:flagellar basal-body rod protein FlgC